MLTVRLETPTKLAALDAGQCVGSLAFSHNRVHYHPEIYSITFSDFAPGANVRVVAHHLYDTLIQKLRPTAPLLLRTGVDEGDELYAVLRSLGFRDYRRVYTPVLDVAAFDLETLQKVESGFAALGYKIVRLADLELTAEVEAQLYDLHTEVYADTSTVVPATPEQLGKKEWLEAFVYSDDVIPEAFFIAARGGKFAAFGNLFRGEVEGDLATGTFGTRRAYRHHHREIMLAIKAHEIGYAKTHGYKKIRAEIDAENPWILYVCAELPFVQDRDYISMVRVMNWTMQP